MNFIEEFQSRGYFYQCTNLEELTKLMKTQKIAAYIGMDATASSLHVGNLMQVMILRLLQKHGHKPIIIIGGATTKVGDPSGKTEMRKMLSDDEVNNNIQSIKSSLAKFINFGDGPSDAIILNNSDWLESLNYFQLLRDFGKYFSVNKMLSMDSVKSRLERHDPLSFLEFNYMIFQAYDFYHLFKNFNCMLQFGGSDQWGNIITGVDLIKKALGKESYGLTTPLLVKSDGQKMGKSANGAIWINEELLSPFEYFQFWRNLDDKDTIKFAPLFTEFNAEEMNKFNQLAEKDINLAKKLLAYSVTEICHGKEAADQAMSLAEKLFESGSFDMEGAPIIKFNFNEINNGLTLYELLVLANVEDSKTAAKKLIKGGGIKINEQKVEDENLIITRDMLIDDSLKLIKGKKKHLIIKFEI